ncbi:Cdc48-Ufd1-Npl4 complex component Ufd1 [Schizosaccharomyces japonicus yFS275]|uniref:Ubiquitin fusion degradation protein 1 n=1 Tax=Schizosaccharomyces japonicus (strain yFS275 / FY16936) TaxID=402676 RepID=B6K6P7_SCHJY|nr:Cdc48-Ufd1-Npl4 complex component Ufd1 [Schizosaccharomyces japonicus yFS275]EEB09201.1 Cdc48-Ufd1-Npl4 complex component Ufd1 [Schizosaccharomyces japonicus yFS275]
MFPQFQNAFASNANLTFDTYYRCYPTAMLPGEERPNLNYGGKVILPPSALEKLSRLNISYPMLFEFQNKQTGQRTHGGVLEFIADEGRVYLPHWMMSTLGVQPGDLIRVINTDIQQGSFVKLQPQSSNFLDITNHRAVLESALRDFSTLTQGDVIEILYNDQVYKLAVLEVKPEDGRGVISVVETDLVVDFAPPVGYEQEMQRKQQEMAKSKVPPSVEGTMAKRIHYDELVAKGSSLSAHGSGSKLNGKGTKSKSPVAKIDVTKQRAPAALDLPLGVYFFGYPYVPPKNQADEADEDSNRFSGAGSSLRTARKHKKNSKRSSGAGSSVNPISVSD